MPWISTISPDLLEADGLAPAQVGKLRVVIYQAEGNFYATSAICTHGEADLADGYLDGFNIECPFHQGLFDIRTGEAVGPPCHEPIKTFAVRLIDGSLEVEVPEEALA